MTKDEEFLRGSREKYKRAQDAWDHIFKAGLDDIRFTYDVDDGQWPDEIKTERKGRPMITNNKLQKFVRKLRGETKMNKARIKVIPVDDKGDVDKASLYNGLIRQIEYESSADVAYDTAYQYAVSCSLGFFRIVTEYEDEWSFNQKIKIKRVKNPFSVLYDPSANEFDLSDANYCYVEESFERKEFEALYPGAKTFGFKEAEREGIGMEGWYNDENVRVCEYFYREFRDAKIAQTEIRVPDGIMTGVMELTPQSLAALKKRGGRVLAERKTKIPTVHWCKHTGAEVLEKADWPGKYIPVIPVFGDEVILEGKRYLLSLIRGAKEPQRMYNYWISAATEAVALVPKSPFIIAAKQIEGYEPEWDDANVKSRPYVRYKGVAGIPPPQRQPQAQIPTGMITMMQNAAADIEDHLGMYEASKGAPSNERSGDAIEARQLQSDKGTFTFVDNLSRAIVYGGRQLIDLIPKIYDTQRALSVMGEDGTQQVVTVNRNTGRLDEAGNAIVENDLAVGKFDLIATVGASYASRRQEAETKVREVMQYAPDIAPIIAPIYFKYSDWEGAQELHQILTQHMQNQQALAQKGQAPGGG